MITFDQLYAALPENLKKKVSMDDVKTTLTRLNEEPASIVHLKPGYTEIGLHKDDRAKAIQAAMWVTASECEHVWTLQQQADMARYVLWACQRLEAICGLADGGDFSHLSSQ